MHRRPPATLRRSALPGHWLHKPLSQVASERHVSQSTYQSNLCLEHWNAPHPYLRAASARDSSSRPWAKGPAVAEGQNTPGSQVSSKMQELPPAASSTHPRPHPQAGLLLGEFSTQKPTTGREAAPLTRALRKRFSWRMESCRKSQS